VLRGPIEQQQTNHRSAVRPEQFGQMTRQIGFAQPRQKRQKRRTSHVAVFVLHHSFKQRRVGLAQFIQAPHGVESAHRMFVKKTAQNRRS
jgi:hypothetical protein